MIETGLVAIGFLGAFAAQAIVGAARRAWGIRTARERAEVLQVAAEKRAQDAEDRLRLAEMEIARTGNAAPKRISARPIS